VSQLRPAQWWFWYDAPEVSGDPFYTPEGDQNLIVHQPDTDMLSQALNQAIANGEFPYASY
jgi:hypothetical protein